MTSDYDDHLRRLRAHYLQRLELIERSYTHTNRAIDVQLLKELNTLRIGIAAIDAQLQLDDSPRKERAVGA